MKPFPIAVIALSLLPFAVTAAPIRVAHAQGSEAPAAVPTPNSEPAAGKSILIESQIPASAMRMTRPADVARQLVLLKPVAGNAGLKLGKAEVLVWGGTGYTAGVARNTKIFLAWGLRDKKYRYDVLGEEEVEGARLTYFLVRSAEGEGKMLLGCWMATGTDDQTQLALIWSTVTRASPAAKKPKG